MEAYAKLVADVSKSLNQFRDDNTTQNQGRDHLVEQQSQLAFDATLDRGLGLRRVAGVERSSAEEYPRVTIQVQPRQRCRLHPDAVKPVGSQPGQLQERGILLLRGQILSSRRQQQEGLHGQILGDRRRCRRLPPRDP